MPESCLCLGISHITLAHKMVQLVCYPILEHVCIFIYFWKSGPEDAREGLEASVVCKGQRLGYPPLHWRVLGSQGTGEMGNMP